jgi:hypothetical protein
MAAWASTDSAEMVGVGEKCGDVLVEGLSPPRPNEVKKEAGKKFGKTGVASVAGRPSKASCGSEMKRDFIA